jgi:hypothetical protein
MIIEWCLINNLTKIEIINLLEPKTVKIHCIPTYNVTTLNIDQEIINFLIKEISSSTIKVQVVFPDFKSD